MPKFIRAFLANRKFKVKVGNTFSTLHNQGGVPQGSVLSVTLFALAINGIASVIPKDVLFSLFVDDLSLSFVASRMTVAERKLQLTTPIGRITEWAERRGFRSSASKTVVVHFCKIRGVHPDPDFYVYGQLITCKDEARFLGLIFDSKLSWVPHLKDLKVRCSQALNIFSVLSHTSWGAGRGYLTTLYKALISSKLAYGCEVYSSATRARLSLFDPIHNAGIRLAAGAFKKSSPIPSLLVDAGELPLDLHRQLLLV